MADGTLTEVAIAPEVLLLGDRLDANHVPVTNGRMAICRRCGAYTDSPLGCRHVPSPTRLDRAREWLDVNTSVHQLTDRKVSVNG